jgi:hypothetical protein
LTSQTLTFMPATTRLSAIQRKPQLTRGALGLLAVDLARGNVGTSAGAMNGAFKATRPQTVETARELAAIWRDLRRAQVFPLNPLTGLLGFLGARDHLVPASGMGKLIARNVQHEALEQMPIPLLPAHPR